MSKTHNISDEAAMVFAFLDSPVDSQALWFELLRDRNRILADSTLAPAARLSRQKDLIERSKPWSATRSCDQLYSDISVTYTRMGNAEEACASIRLAAEEAQRARQWARAADYWASLAVSLEGDVPPDSMTTLYQRSIDLARRVRDPLTCGRAHSFLAAYYMHCGELAAARAEDDRAIEVCRELQGEYDEMRFLVDQMQRYANFGCWTFVERHLRRTRAIAGNASAEAALPSRIVPFVRDIRALEARLAMARGQIDSGEALFDSLDVTSNATTDPVKTTGLLLQRARALIEHGRDEAALRHLRRARTLVETQSVQGYERGLTEMEARALFSLGRDAECLVALEHLRRLTAGELATLTTPRLGSRLAEDGIRARVCTRAGKLEEAREAVRDGLDAFAALADRLEPDFQSHLFAAEAEDLHAALHDVVGADATSGYAVEMLWREARRAIGSSSEHPIAKRWKRAGAELRRILDAPTASARRAATRAIVARWRSNLRAKSAVHCMLWDDDREIRRWVANGDSVTADRVSRSSREIRAQVDALLESMAAQMRASPEIPGIETRALLSALASDLLPESILSRGSGTRPLLLVSADRSLARIPFDVLSVSGNAYVPIGRAWDVAWFHGLPGAPSRERAPHLPKGTALVFADPRPSPEVLRRFAEGAGLPLAIEEAGEVARMIPGSTLRTGVDASTHALFDSWESARFIHIAAHVIRDPEIPFITFIPLGAAQTNEEIAESTLDDPEIRHADLSGCELVVLSACGSGAPFVDLTVDAPSLSESFLDAGAHAVIHTQWAVRDDDAARLMKSFVRHWRERGLSPVQALNEAKRDAAAAAPNGLLPDPASWGAFSISLNVWPR